MMRNHCLGWLLSLLAGVVAAVPSAPALEVPAWLPRYNLTLHIDPAERLVTARQRVTWTNRHQTPTRYLVFNAHAHYTIPAGDVGKLAKTVELLRMTPKEAMSFDGPALNVSQVVLDPGPVVRTKAAPDDRQLLAFHYQKDNPTALVVPLPRSVGAGESVTVDLTFTVRIPPKKGRWGQWDGVTTLAQWLPVVAYYDDRGWQPAPFIPWHQPFFNEAGIYTATIVLPKDQKLACTGQVTEIEEHANGWRMHRVAATPARDFAVICSDRFQEHLGQAGPVAIRCLALPEHEFYGKEIVKIVQEALPVYNRWFGPFPYKQFTVVEAFFGWNGNECGDLVMIDARMFGMPHIARAYIDYLVSHELCHQWWYNVVGTNGYAETWMDEGLATYFSHRLMNQKLGPNNEMLAYPKGLRWLPNIHREDFRNAGMLGVTARGDARPPVGNMEDFGHLVNLSAMTYDRGSKVVGMIEERLGEAAFLDFIRKIYSKYQFQILRVADFQRELEEYTRQSWHEFFHNWLHSTGTCDWAVDRVEFVAGPRSAFLNRLRRGQKPTTIIVHLSQRGQCNEPAVLGICLDGGEGHQIHLPIPAGCAALDIPELCARVESSVDGCGKTVARVEITLPCPPTQITVDPDQVLLDCNPDNNCWKRRIRWRLTPVYTALEETDVTSSYDRWNVILGPWLYTSSYADPWYERSPMIGLRAGVYRTQLARAGAYLAYRADGRNIIAGADGLIDHFPWPKTQIGFNVERSLATIGTEDVPSSRGVVFGRYIMTYGSSLYLPPFEYAEVFGNIQNRGLPLPRHPFVSADLFDDQTSLGIHYHKNYLTPYWDPEGGIAFDVTYRAGLPCIKADESFHQVFGQLSTVKYFPDWLGLLKETPGLSWLANTRLAFRVAGAAAVPDRGLFFTLGGGDHFRGFDLRERQGSLLWIGSLEWRIPLAQHLTWDCFDHFVGLRNIYLAPFYDIGDIYVRGRSLGPVAHAVGLGLRLDVAWIGLIERTMIRLDVAQALGVDSAVQFWVGIQHPF